MEHLSLSEKEAEDLIVNTTKIATDIRDSDEYTRNDLDHDNRPLVAGSMGTLGKYFEGVKREEAKDGIYKGVTVEDMVEVHRRRFEIICDRTEADILAFETIRDI